MKMRKTVYPAAIIVAIPLVIILFIVLNQGHFKQVMQTVELQDEKAVEGYFSWDGFGIPKIKSVKMEDEKDLMNRLDYFTNDTVEEMAPKSMVNDLDEYKPVLSVRIKANDNQEIKSMPRFNVRYSIFGLNREQTIVLKKGEISN